MENLKEKLKILGLSAGELNVYMALLSIGKGTVTDISRKAGIKRTTIYEYVESLLNVGLIYKTVDGKRISYCLEDPQKIIKILDEQKKQIEEKRIKIEKIIPEIGSLFSASFNRPSVSFYEGRDGIKKVYEQVLDTHKNIYSVFSPDSFFKLFSSRENHGLLMLLYDNGGKMYSLVEKTEKKIEDFGKNKYGDFLKRKQLPDGFKFETDLLVVDDTVAFISFKNLIGVIIKDKSIANLQKDFINLIWKGIK